MSNNNNPVQGDREGSLILRALEPEDLDQLYEIENSMSDWEHSSVNVPLSRYVLRDYIATQKCDLALDGQVRLVVCDEMAREEVIGLADLTNYDPVHRRAEIGLIIKKEWRGRGYGDAALNLLVEFAERTCLLEQIYANISEGNVACCEMFMKSGFEHTATLRNWFFTTSGLQNALLFQFFFKK